MAVIEFSFITGADRVTARAIRAHKLTAFPMEALAVEELFVITLNPNKKP